MKKILTALVIVGTVATMALVAADRERELKLQRAIDLVETKGDVAKATSLLEEVAASSDRALAARALLYLAQAQAPQNKEKARATYQRIIEQFPEQRDVIAKATLSSAALAPVKRQTDELSASRIVSSTLVANDVSLDGRLVVVRCAGALGVCLLDVDGGGLRTLVSDAEAGGVSDAPIISPSGREVAYRWTEKSDGKGRTSIRVIGIDKGAQPRTLTSSEFTLSPADWSPDGKALLLVTARGTANGDGRSLSWVSVSDGSVREIKSFERGRSLMASQVSPDGAFISFSALVREGSIDRYVYVMDRDGQHEEAVVRMAGVNSWPVWTPDGAHLVFSSNRSGQPALWSVPVNGGRAAGEPKLLKIDGADFPIGITRSGELFYGCADPNQGQHVFVAERTTSGTRIVKSFTGEGVSWSPDGKSLAYLRNNAAGKAVILRSVDTGEERAYPNDGLGLAQLRWMPDSSGIVAMVPHADGGALYLLDARTGVFRRLLPRNSSQHVRSAVIEVAPDGKTIYMPFHQAPGSPWQGIVGVDLETLTEKPIVTFAGPGYPGNTVPGLAVSPDGSTLAVQVWATPPRTARLLTVRTDGSGYRELFGPFPATITPSLIRWTRDGRSILFFTHKDGDWQMLRIPAEGGEPERDGLDVKSAAASASGAPPAHPLSLDLSPDGTHIVFGAWRRSTGEIRSVGNLLSHLTPRR